MSRQVQIRRGSATAHTNFTGAIGEITMDTTNKTLRVHDGETVGGIKLAKQSEFLSKVNTNMDNISDTGTQNIVSLCVPNYELSAPLTLPNVGQKYTVPYNCEIYLSAIGSASGYVKIRLNNSTGPILVNFASDSVAF